MAANLKTAQSQSNQELTQVQIDGLVFLKIVQHCQDFAPNQVTGQLLGQQQGNTLEVTECFAFPSNDGDEQGMNEEEGTSYSLDMTKCYRDINLDSKIVGWYHSTPYGVYQNVSVIQGFISYRESSRTCICLVYDPTKSSSQSGLALKAIKLKESFIKQYRENSLGVEQLIKANLSWKDVFEELTITVHNSLLTPLVMSTLYDGQAIGEKDIQSLQLSNSNYMEGNVEQLNDCIYEIIDESQKVQKAYREMQRDNMQIKLLQKKRLEQGLSDDVNFGFKQEPSQLVTYLLCNQVKHTYDQVEDYATKSLQKLYLAQEFQKRDGMYT